MKDIFADYSVQDNAELDDELDKLAGELANEELPDANKCKYIL